MQVKSRIFPYPILNHDVNYSNYVGCDFKLNYDGSEDDDNYLLKDVCYEINSDSLNKLIDENKISICCIIECSYTVVRRKFEIEKNKKIDIVLPKSEFSGKVDISIFAYANQDLILKSSEFDPDYQGIDYEIEKYDILAADDGFYVYFNRRDQESSLASSIFSIIIDRKIKDNTYSVNYEARRITISLSEEEYQNYRTIYTIPSYKEVFFNMLLIPCLTEALTRCGVKLENGDYDIDTLGSEYLWFGSIAEAYSKLFGKELTKEDYLKTKPIELAQKLMGEPLGKSLESLINEMNRTQSEGE